MLNKLAKLINYYDGTAYLVGGAVRDELLELENKDLDVEVFGIPEMPLSVIIEIFARKNNLSFSQAGKSYRVYKLRDSEGNEIDVSLPRKDTKVSSGHKGFETTADPFMSVEEAASRRDFTINAIYKNILTGEIVNPTFLGVSDLNNGILRMVDKRAFADDPLRVLRGLQFAARFNMMLDYNTHAEMSKVNLTELPAERIFTELEKALLKSDTPSVFFQRGMTMQNFADLFPELDALITVSQDPVWHPEGNVFTHTMLAIDKMARIVKEKNLTKAEKLTVMLAILCHDLGKASTTTFEEGRVRAHGHSEAGIQPTESLLNRLNVHTVDGFPVRETVLKLVEYHLFPAQLSAKHEGVNVPRALRRMAQKVRLDLLAMVSLADMLGRATSEITKQEDRAKIAWFLEQAENCHVTNKSIEPILRGRHLIELGMKPGIGMGEILNRVFEMQLDGQITTLEQAIATAKSCWAFGTQLA